MSATCIACNKPATKRLSPDLDIQGIAVCDEHVEQVQLDLLIAFSEPQMEKWFESKYFKAKRTMKRNSAYIDDSMKAEKRLERKTYKTPPPKRRQR